MKDGCDLCGKLGHHDDFKRLHDGSISIWLCKSCNRRRFLARMREFFRIR